MIGALPKTLTVNGREMAIRSDFRNVLLILEAMEDPELTEEEKTVVLLDILYVNPDYSKESADKATWFLNGGDVPPLQETKKPLMSWKQDEQILFSAVNNVAGTETRALPYMHWWTFLGLFGSIGESTFATVVSIRNKISNGKPLEKWEREYLRKNASIVTLKTAESESEIEERNRINSIFN